MEYLDCRERVADAARIPPAFRLPNDEQQAANRGDYEKYFQSELNEALKPYAQPVSMFEASKGIRPTEEQLEAFRANQLAPDPESLQAEIHTES